MSVQIVRGDLLGVSDGPSMILNVNGEEQKFDLSVSLSVSWITKHMGKTILAKIENNSITEIV